MQIGHRIKLLRTITRQLDRTEFKIASVLATSTIPLTMEVIKFKANVKSKDLQQALESLLYYGLARKIFSEYIFEDEEKNQHLDLLKTSFLARKKQYLEDWERLHPGEPPLLFGGSPR